MEIKNRDGKVCVYTFIKNIKDIYLTATLVDTISKYMVQYVDTEHKSTILCRPNVLKDR